jgi:hypothetical protein
MSSPFVHLYVSDVAMIAAEQCGRVGLLAEDESVVGDGTG